MKSKASYFSISGTLITENFRRFWALPAVGFLAYLLSGIGPIVLQYNVGIRKYSANFIGNALGNENPIFVMLLIILPVAAAILVLEYMHQSAPACSMHAMPFSRTKLFNSSFISGFALCTVPMLLTGVIYVIISEPTYYSYAYDEFDNLLPDAFNVFSVGRVFGWMGESLLIMLFIYAIAIFAGIVTGNIAMHCFAALGFNFLAPALALIVVGFSEMYLYGYVEEPIWILDLSPLLKTVGSYIGPLWAAVYAAIAIAVIIASALLYHSRRNEKTGESLSFGFMIPVVCYILSLFGMMLMAIYFEAMGFGEMFRYVGFAAGSVLAFIIARMITLKSLHVFNKQSLKSFGGYCVAAVLIICIFAFDLTGFESRIPDAEKVASANSNVVTNILNESLVSGNRFSPYHFNLPGGERGDTFRAYFTSPDNIERFQALHKGIIDDRSDDYGGLFSYITGGVPADGQYYLNFYNTTVLLNYELENGKLFRRRYRIPVSEEWRHEYIAGIYESEEFKEVFALSNLQYDRIEEVSLFNELKGEGIIFKGAEAMELFRAMDADFAARTFAEEVSPMEKGIVTLNIRYIFTYNPRDYYDYDIQSLNVQLHLNDANTIAWLTEHGAEEYLEISSDDVARVAVNKYEYDYDIDYYAPQGAAYAPTMDVAYNEHYEAEVTDAEQIQYILDNGACRRTEPGAFYEIGVWSKAGNTQYLQELEEMLKRGEINYDYYKYESEVNSSYKTATLYIMEDDAPDFLKELFK